jgi:4-amino-4-deoxy-L-arabinose transferase-like glycosyltransferase
MTFEVESDLLWQFMPDAERLLRGEPLVIQHHPPLYSIALALLNAVVGDWFTAGRIISVVCTVLAFLFTFWFFQRLLGRAAAWWAAAGTVLSAPLLAHGAMASADMLFLALYCAALYFALAAAQTDRWTRWLAAGLFTGCAVLVRTNGIALLPLLALPMLTPGCARVRALGTQTIGIAAPVLVWIALALATHSPLAPSGNYASLAWHYYAPQLTFHDGYAQMSQQFHGTLDVLLRDPVHIAKTYVREAYYAATTSLSGDFLISTPMSLFIAPGIVLLLLRASRLAWTFVILTVVPHFLLLVLAGFTTRLGIFLVPWLAVAAGECVRWLVRSAADSRLRPAVKALFAATLLLAVVSTVRMSADMLHEQDRELSAVVAAVPRSVQLGPEDVLAARKEHLPYYLHVRYAFVPISIETPEDLLAFLRAQRGSHELYLYTGSAERRQLPRLPAFLAAGLAEGWLVPVIERAPDRDWALYRLAAARD